MAFRFFWKLRKILLRCWDIAGQSWKIYKAAIHNCQRFAQYLSLRFFTQNIFLKHDNSTNFNPFTLKFSGMNHIYMLHDLNQFLIEKIIFCWVMNFFPMHFSVNFGVFFLTKNFFFWRVIIFRKMIQSLKNWFIG